jgi:hypothetical protein
MEIKHGQASLESSEYYLNTILRVRIRMHAMFLHNMANISVQSEHIDERGNTNAKYDSLQAALKL